MPLSLRSHSINTYCLSKVWFKCPSINLRVCDHDKITSSIKSWLFQDQLVKPEDFVLYRPRFLGGLGLVHVETKALALQIRSFLETASNPQFRRNLYHQALFKWHIENDRSIPNPGLPPYYPDSFFARIREVKEEGLLNISTLDTAKWYRALLEINVTHTVNDNGVQVPRTCRIESKYPLLDWEQTWNLAVTPGLPSDQTTFLWQMLHDILPTRERLFRLSMPDISSPTCDLCTMEAEDNIQHALLQCSFNSANSLILRTIQTILPNAQPSQVVLLQLPVEEDLRLPITFLISSCLSQVWQSRKLKKPSPLTSIRANLEAGVQILQKNRHQKAALKVEELLNSVDVSIFEKGHKWPEMH